MNPEDHCVKGLADGEGNPGPPRQGAPGLGRTAAITDGGLS
jgi:hypothetical protein